MALTDKQKHQILFRLGWAGKTLVEDSTTFSKITKNRLENLTPEIEAIVKDLLKRLDEVQDQMDEARCRLSASKVGDITLNKQELECLKLEFTRYVRELSREIDISIMRKGGVNLGVVV